MVFELHVLGPAFGLPSIDAECLAAIAYVNRAIPSGEWVLIADHDASISPRHELPLLVAEDAQATGFVDIVALLRKHQFDLDLNLTPEQLTDRTAFFSFLQSTGGSLIDISLYVSAENYNAATSSAYTAILPWYLNYTIPPRRREKARLRTSHLGFGSLDISPEQDAASQPGGRSLHSSFEAAKRDAGAQPQNKVLSMGRAAGVGGLLSSPVYAARFKLDALANELLEPLADLLGKKKYLFSENSPSSLDCLAFGYLALMFYPAVPQAWLKEALDQRFPRLSQYVQFMRQELIGGEEVKATDIWTLSSAGKDDAEIQCSLHRLGLHLPWRPRKARPFTTAVSKATLELASKFPLVSAALQSRAVIRDNNPNSLVTIQSSLPSALAVNTVYAFAAVVTATVAALAVQHRRSVRDGPLIFWALRPQASAPGEAQQLLGIFAGQLGI